MSPAISRAIPYTVPVLLAALLLLVTGRRLGLIRQKSSFGQLAALLLAVPLALERTGGASIAQLALLLSPAYSALSIAILAGLIFSQFWDRPVFSRRDWALLLGFIMIVSAFLYPSVLGFGGYDAYSWGYRFSWVFAAVAAYTVLLIVLKSPVAWVLLFTIATFDLGLLPHSENFFDYLVDGPLLLASCGIVTVWLVRKLRNRAAPRQQAR